MPAYKVNTRFPSRNGAKEYKEGQIIQLEENSRTKSLIEMGYIEPAEEEECSIEIWLERVMRNYPPIKAARIKKYKKCGKRKFIYIEAELEEMDD